MREEEAGAAQELRQARRVNSAARALKQRSQAQPALARQRDRRAGAQGAGGHAGEGRIHGCGAMRMGAALQPVRRSPSWRFLCSAPAPLALAHEELPPPVAARVQLAAAQRATRENSRRTGPEPAPEPAPEPRPGRKLAVLAVLNRSSCGWAHAHRVAQQRIGTALHHL